MKCLLLIVLSVASTTMSQPTEEDVRTGVMFNQLAIAELVKQQRNFEDVRNQISTMSASLVSSQSFLLSFLEKAANRIDSTAGTITTHLAESKDHMESLAAIVLAMQQEQHNLTEEMQKAMLESKKATEEHSASITNLLLEANSRLDALEKSVQGLPVPSDNPPEGNMPNEEPVPDTICPPPFFNVGSECFYVLEARLTWMQAYQNCQKLRINEPSPRNQEEQTDIIFFLPPRRLKRRGSRNNYKIELAEPSDIPALQAKLREHGGYLGDYFWIGGHRLDNKWKWLSNTDIDPRIWIGGYPRRRDQVVLMRTDKTPLASRSGRQRYPAVCEVVFRQ